MIYDVHAHCLPTVVDELLRERRGVDAMARPLSVPLDEPVSDSDEDIEARLRMMDDAGVEIQILSANLPLLGREDDAVELVRLVNDAHANVARRFPDRFQAYIELPLPHLRAAFAELTRCREELGMSAVNILASHGAVSAVDEQFDPLFEELDRSGTVIFFHPRVSGLCSPLLIDYNLAGRLGPALEDTVLVFQMLTRQFPLRYPNLKIIIPHLGGMLPIYMERMDNQMGRLLVDLPERPSTVVKRLWFDTVSHCSLVALRSAHESFGADRLVTGSDYPAMQHFQGYRASLDYIREASLPAEHVHRILHVNAAELFGLTSSQPMP
jgi:predicted TIM-barrel fold metal-dependent hydrolase